MSITRQVLATVAGAALAVAACKGERAGGTQEAGGATETRATAKDRISAGGVLPPPNALSAARPANLSPDAGAALFSSMNCDGCHGGGAVGWVGPSLVDGRWRYGGSDEEIFTSIVYGRPKGMPAYGGVIGTDGAWMLVAYIKAQAVPPVVPTTSWLPGGNATNPPSGGVKEGNQPEEADSAAAPAAAPAVAQPAQQASVSPDQ